MARARSLKPGFFHDTKLTALKPLNRLLFAGLWCYADREGRLNDDVRQIKHDILPDDRCDVEAMLSELASGDRPFITRYEVERSRYIQIRSFKRHQNPHVKEAASIIPAPGLHQTEPGNSGTSRADSFNPLPFNPVTDSGNLEPGAAPPGGFRLKNPSASDTSNVSTRSEEFWERWPDKVGKDSFVRAWSSCVTVVDESQLFECLSRYENSQEWARGWYGGGSTTAAKWIFDRKKNNWDDRPSPARAQASNKALSPMEQERERLIKKYPEKTA